MTDAQGQGYLKRVRAATQRMGDLIDHLLKLGVTAVERKCLDVLGRKGR